MRRKVRFTIPILLVLMLVACASFEKNTYRTLSTTGVLYDTGMKSVASLQAKGQITEAQRAEINKYATPVYDAYQAGVAAFKAWKISQTADAQAKAQAAVGALNKIWASFADAINKFTPALLPSTLQ